MGEAEAKNFETDEADLCRRAARQAERAGEVVYPWEGGADGGGSVALASSGTKFISFDGLVPSRSQKSSFDSVSE
jgi:hypothetical protein